MASYRGPLLQLLLLPSVLITYQLLLPRTSIGGGSRSLIGVGKEATAAAGAAVGGPRGDLRRKEAVPAGLVVRLVVDDDLPPRAAAPPPLLALVGVVLVAVDEVRGRRPLPA